MVNMYVVRIVRKKWWRNDYVGCYAALSPVRALTIAGRDPRLRQVMDKTVVRVEAIALGDVVDTEETTVRNVRTVPIKKIVA